MQSVYDELIKVKTVNTGGVPKVENKENNILDTDNVFNKYKEGNKLWNKTHKEFLVILLNEQQNKTEKNLKNDIYKTYQQKFSWEALFVRKEAKKFGLTYKRNKNIKYNEG